MTSPASATCHQGTRGEVDSIGSLQTTSRLHRPTRPHDIRARVAREPTAVRGHTPLPGGELRSRIGLEVATRRATPRSDRNDSLPGQLRTHPERFLRDPCRPKADPPVVVALVEHETLFHSALALRALMRTSHSRCSLSVQ